MGRGSILYIEGENGKGFYIICCWGEGEGV